MFLPSCQFPATRREVLPPKSITFSLLAWRHGSCSLRHRDHKMSQGALVTCHHTSPNIIKHQRDPVGRQGSGVVNHIEPMTGDVTGSIRIEAQGSMSHEQRTPSPEPCRPRCATSSYILIPLALHVAVHVALHVAMWLSCFTRARLSHLFPAQLWSPHPGHTSTATKPSTAQGTDGHGVSHNRRGGKDWKTSSHTYQINSNTFKSYQHITSRILRCF